jgi:hypothetical protein
LLFLSSEFVEARLYRGEVSDCWGHDKQYLVLAVRYAVMLRPRTAKRSRRALFNLSSIKISSCLSAGTKAASAGSPRAGPRLYPRCAVNQWMSRASVTLWRQ